MKRRNLLAGIPLVATGLSGCLGGRTTEHYKECTHRDVVSVGRLPSAAEDEVRAAIEDGEYETDGELVLTKVIDIDQKYLESYVDGDTIYYKATVETDDGFMGIFDSTRLFVEKTWPKHGGKIRCENMTKMDLTADIRIEHEGDLFLEESIDMRAGNGVKAYDGYSGEGGKELEGESDYRWGKYYAEVSIENDGVIYSDDDTWRVEDWRGHPAIGIFSGNDEGDEIDIYFSSHESDAPRDCSWN